ncbi:MAG: hypothetical protein STHCBS139747_007881 [Sporothrix thermara]
MAAAPRTLSRQQYARLLATNDNDYENAMADSASDDSIPMTPTSSTRRKMERRPSKKQTAALRPGCLPTARRFWADFTLGFADGLTVPFALTAGLSSLGRTDTVVYAGLAEVSAGCISMGIGGYLSARQAGAASGGGSGDGDDSSINEKEEEDEEEEEEEHHHLQRPSYRQDDLEAGPEMAERCRRQKAPADLAAAAHRYLAPLALPADLHEQLLAHVTTEPRAAAGLRRATATDYGRSSDNNNDSDDNGEIGYGYEYNEAPTQITSTSTSDNDNDNDDAAVWPVASGVSVALGYLIGGLLPLWPYFFVQSVGDGLRYSFAACVVALFVFGFVKDFSLDGPSATPSSSSSPSSLSTAYRSSRIPWRRLWKSAFEGLQMVILGGIAAIAAVLCVRLFEGANSTESA